MQVNEIFRRKLPLEKNFSAEKSQFQIDYVLQSAAEAIEVLEVQNQRFVKVNTRKRQLSSTD